MSIHRTNIREKGYKFSPSRQKVGSILRKAGLQALEKGGWARVKSMTWNGYELRESYMDPWELTLTYFCGRGVTGIREIREKAMIKALEDAGIKYEVMGEIGKGITITIPQVVG